MQPHAIAMAACKTALKEPGFASTRFTRDIERRVLRFITRHGILSGGEHGVVAVSGGQDSCALLVILSRLANRLDLGITVGHFDHMLREPEETASDEAFVRGLANVLGLPCVCGRGDVPARVRSLGESVEDAARKMRYEFLAEAAAGCGAGVVVLGHTLDDQAESVLLHILRGSGIDGLAGMRPRSSWPLGAGPDVGRPLLEVRRAETARYCGEAGLQPREDPTNDLLVATRNRIRHEVLPVLRSLNPRVDEALARLADAAAADAAHVNRLADDAWTRVASADASGVTLRRDALVTEPPAVVVRFLRRAVAEVLGSAADLEAVHVAEILAALAAPVTRQRRLSLPHGLTALLDGRSLRIVRGEPAVTPGIPETPIQVPGSTEAGTWRIAADIVPAPADPRSGGPLTAYLDATSVAGGLVVRSRRRGDRLRPLGLGGEKKVQDVLVDARVPRAERDGVPIVSAAWGIVWVVGRCIDQRAALGPGSREAVRLQISRRNA